MFPVCDIILSRILQSGINGCLLRDGLTRKRPFLKKLRSDLFHHSLNIIHKVADRLNGLSGLLFKGFFV